MTSPGRTNDASSILRAQPHNVLEESELSVFSLFMHSELPLRPANSSQPDAVYGDRIPPPRQEQFDKTTGIWRPDYVAPRHRWRIQFSRQLSQHLRHHFFRISLHRTSHFRPLQGCFTPLARLAILLQGRSPYSQIAPLSALINGSLSPSVIGDRPSHPICFAS